MKASRYNRLFQTEDGNWLLFNSWSVALGQIEDEDLDFVRALLADPEDTPCDSEPKREIRETMLEGHFLLEDEQDELLALKANMMRDRFRTDQLHLTIAPTLNCNFRCDYCYEEHLKVTMSGAVQDALVRWVEGRAGATGSLHVTWYGGEPLLPEAYGILQNLSERFLALAEEHGLHYAADIVTNGYFLDRKKMLRLKDLRVEQVQVTLDGPPELHDQRRVLAGGQGTFWKIIENLEETVDLVPFQARVNIDQRNASACLELLQLLKERGLHDQVSCYLGQVVDSAAACGNIQESCYSNEGFARSEAQLGREAGRRGLNLNRYPYRIEGAFCTSDRANGYVVSPQGLLYKCWNQITTSPDHAVGSVLDEQTLLQKAVEDRWLAWDCLEKSACRDCDVLPLCHGGCPLEALKVPDSDCGACSREKFTLQEILETRFAFGPADPDPRPAGPSARDLNH